MSSEDFQEIEHTADWALRVRGTSHAALFANAARGMFSLLADLSAIEDVRRFDVELEAIDLETLLIDWLNELLFLSEEERIVFSDFEVTDLAAGDGEGGTRLRATVKGGPPPDFDKTIKAATFSSLQIVGDADGYGAELVFDV